MITVRRLVGDSFPDLKIVAGEAGDFRLITWAHTVDLPDPWRWISAGNLVMTTGTGLPQGAAEQVAWLEQLAASDASALLVAAKPDTVELRDDMLKAADRLGFPVITANFELEFIGLSRSIIESVLQAQRDKLRASERLFQVYAQALRERSDLAERLAILSEHLDLDIEVEDAASGVTVLSSRSGQDPRRAVPNQPPNQRECVEITGRTRANLVIHQRQPSGVTDPLVVRSLAGLLGVEMERVMITRDEQREEGTVLLSSLLNGETEFASVRPILERRGLHGTLVSLAIRTSGQGAWRVDEIHQAPGLHTGTPLFLEQEGMLLALSLDTDAILQGLINHLGAGTAIGISAPLTAAAGFRDSVRQARLALTQAEENNLSMRRYGEDVEAGLILSPRTLAEARALVGRYLGPLIDYDQANDTPLLKTLATFLEHDGNWKVAAFELNIHRQTLVYRLKLIERLTGFKPTTTNGSARFWLALQAGQTAGLFEQ